MLNEFLKQLERRTPIENLTSRFKDLFDRASPDRPTFSRQGFDALVRFLREGEPSFQAVAVQAGVRWSSAAQRVTLRNAVIERGLLSSSCLWAYKELRGGYDELFREYASPEMEFMQVLLLKEADPAQAVPFLLERFITRKEAVEELRTAARLSVLRLLDDAASPELLHSLQARFPGVEILFQWRPPIPWRDADLVRENKAAAVDFHQLVRSVHDMRELSSLTRTLYLLSLFHVPLSDREWRSLWLSRTDRMFFQRLAMSGVVETSNGGLMLSTDPHKRKPVRKFLYEKYALARETVHRRSVERTKEERQRRVRTTGLDRQALEMLPDGVICVDGTGLFYYMNQAAETMLNGSAALRERLFGNGSVEDALRRYSRESTLARIKASIRDKGDEAEVFGDRVAIALEGKRFEVELGHQVILIRDTTDRHLIEQEIGKLYRHELKAALDVMGAGMSTVQEFIRRDRSEEALQVLEEVEQRRRELFTMMEERIDFIRLHSDAFQIRPTAVNLNAVVDKCFGNYRDATQGKGMKLESNHLHADCVMVQGEERFLVRALDNIIRNAVKFSGEGASISVTLGMEGLDAFVSVKDSGPGILPEDLGKVFQLGFTTGGTGRGLYLARRIAAAHRGRLDVKSRPGAGSCFTLRLPNLPES